MPFTCIAAVCTGRGIGYENGIPWRDSDAGTIDMKYFRARTTGHVVIMGRKTAESIPSKYFPLNDRVNIVVTTEVTGRITFGLNTDTPIYYVNSFENALLVASRYKRRDTYVIGGGVMYQTAFSHPECERAIISRIPEWYQCDTFIDLEPIHEWNHFAIHYMGLTIDVYEK